MYLGPDFKSILTGIVSIDAQGRVGVQEVISITNPILWIDYVLIMDWFFWLKHFLGGICKAARGSFDRVGTITAQEFILSFDLTWLDLYCMIETLYAIVIAWLIVILAKG